MNRAFLFILFFLASLGCSSNPKQHLPPSAMNPASLVGKWKVDLRPTPSSPEYFQIFVVSKIEGKKISGTFYGAPFENGLLNTDWAEVHFAFETQDLSGPYHHSGTLRGERLEGLTRSTGRNFLSYWTATKEK